MSIEIDRNELYDLYINQNKTRQEVADVFGVSSNQIKYLVKKLNMIKPRDLFSINIGKSLIGKEISTETKEKISKSKQNSIPWNKGLTKESDSRVAKYSMLNKGKKGRVLTDSQRKLISKRTKEAMNNIDVKNKIILNNKTRIYTDEQRKRRSINAIKLWNNPEYAAKCHNSKFGNKPIYNNIKFMSDTEMMFAKELDKLSLKYVYQPCHIKYLNFIDNKYHNYYPDFYIPKYNLYLEVKYNKNYTYDSRLQFKLDGMKKLNLVCILVDRKDLSNLLSIIENVTIG